jgi:transcription-repair coupling factor (superfamily II helicase)
VLKEILESENILALHHALQNQDSILIEELWNSPKALVSSLAQQATGKNILILTGASQEEIRLFHDFSLFSEVPVVDFPAWETLPSENIAPSPDIVGERYKVLEEIQKRPHIILSGLQACLQKIIPPKRFRELHLTLKINATFSFDALIQKLHEMGYKRSPVVSDKAEFAVRGGIIDVFPVSSPDPFRLEFWGDELESIRIFDPIGQKSIRQVQEALIPPAQELELLTKTEQLSTLLDYLGLNTIVVFDDLLALEDRYVTLLNMCGTPTRSFSSIEQFLDQLQPLQKIFLTQTPIESLSELQVLKKSKQGFYSDSANLHEIQFQMFNRDLKAKLWKNPFISISDYLVPEGEDDSNISGQDIIHGLSHLSQSDEKLIVLCATELEEENFQKKLTEARVKLPSNTHFKLGYLSSGFVLKDLHLILLPLTEITHRYKIRRQKQRSTYHQAPFEVYQLNPGDLVVHLNHGIGKFLGIEKRPNHMGIPSEFFQIEYADSAKLYVPLNQAHLISKYIGAQEELPKMHALGSNRWKKSKESTERAIMGYASELLQLYAQRELKGGFSYPTDSLEMHAFEEEFPFVETEDQLAAIENIKSDMCSSKSMDRLICGDVGYGKTEVAMRAAFKAVMDGKKQVAILVPTTVLAMQHYETFLERMAQFPINIAVLSRFRTAKQIRETLEGVEKGSIDIVVGTHRVISQDVKFKDLGLIIIDEEQRFGVKAKEHLKKIKAGVECLTLSATPIPRTLYMSMIGARDMSVISTPPQDRIPITTIITEPSDQTLKNALLRELARDGQAFYIHNRVETIFEAANRIKKLLPQARVVVGHGQMDADELDTVFHAFKSGEADILVATTIVENGIDIPNANTILIERADRFGLADLYQMRGRVGRWNRRAYAYFLVPNLRSLPDISRKRLNALAEASGYGGGMKLAMRDLEIRGAGDILGLEQSGHVSAIGFHLYCKMLKRTIHTLQGKLSSTLTDTRMEFNTIDARIPEDYVNETALRMEIYQRLGEANSFEEVDHLWSEVLDRFGPSPEPAAWLYHLTRIRVFGSLNGFSFLKLEKIALTAEQQKGKLTQTKKTLLPKPQDPKDLESKVLKFLKREFHIL